MTQPPDRADRFGGWGATVVGVSSVTSTAGGSSLRLPPATGGLSRSRQLWGLGLVAAGLPLCTVALASMRSTLSLPSDLLIYLLAVVAIAVVGGVVPAVVGAVVAGLLLNYWFTPPYHTLTIARRDHLFALVVFLVVAVTVSVTVDLSARLRLRAARSGAEAATLTRLAEQPLAEHSLPGVLEQVRTAFGMDAVALLRRDSADRWVAVDSVGAGRDWSDGEGDIVQPANDRLRLVGWGPALFAEDHRVLSAYAAAALRAMQTQELAGQAARSRELAAVDRLRSALLAAVGHDLRTPLASIKASVSTLRQDDVTWTVAESAELLATIEESADRLDDLVANLLDMSRLQAGAVSVQSQPVPMDEAVHQALLGLPDDLVEVPESEVFPVVTADPGLLERVLANLIANAVRFAPSDRPVSVTAAREGNIAHLYVVDHGPGVAAKDRDRMFAPFQRLDDRGVRGVGLGLAIARGFTEAMGGTLVASETPGGGLTMTVSLPVPA